MLKLDVIKAKDGDCLLLRHGSADDPALTLIDGGPGAVFADHLAPRLAELQPDAPQKGPVDLELAMISHIDRDHVAGMYKLLQAIDNAKGDGEPEPYEVKRLWHNAFMPLTGATPTALEKAASAAGGAPEEMVIASAPEGENASAIAKELGIPINEDGEGDLLLAGAEPTKLSGGLNLTVIGPSPKRIEELQKKWAEKIGVEPSELTPAAVKEVRDTVTNMSSLIVVAEQGGKRLLLTGDAIAADIVNGLEDTGLLEDPGPPAHFDVLKLPHHGDDTNVNEEFFEQVTADHYVASGNGKHGNPELETLRMIAKARGNAVYDIWLTYSEGKEGLSENVETFAKEQKEAGWQGQLHFPGDGEHSMTIDLD